MLGIFSLWLWYKPTRAGLSVDHRMFQQSVTSYMFVTSMLVVVGQHCKFPQLLIYQIQPQTGGVAGVTEQLFRYSSRPVQ